MSQLDARVGDTVTIGKQRFQLIPTPSFSEAELHRCWCCTPAKRTVITLDGAGREQFTCPQSKQTARYSEGASRVPGTTDTKPTYLIGGSR